MKSILKKELKFGNKFKKRIALGVAKMEVELGRKNVSQKVEFLSLVDLGGRIGKNKASLI